MKIIIPTTRFSRDKKRMAKRGADFRKLHTILLCLQLGEPLPHSARPHKLGGEWDGFWECHVETDWLLIYDITDEAVLLAGTGSHTDLFE